jgi:hypothetical protein
LLTTVAVMGCAGSDDDVDSAPTTTADAAVPAESDDAEWVAIYAVEAAETGERQAFIDAAGPLVFEGPATCWQDVPARLGVSEAQVLGVAAPTEDRLRDTITLRPGAPILTGSFVRVCPSGA